MNSKPWKLFLAALLFRFALLTFLYVHTDWSSWFVHSETANVALSLAQGHGYANAYWGPPTPTAWLCPVYPTMLAGLFLLFGVKSIASIIAAGLLNCVLAAFTALLVREIGTGIFGNKAGICAAWMFALCPFSALVPYFVWDSTLSALVLAMAVLSTIRLGPVSSPGKWLWCGVLWGAAGLVTAALLAPLPVIAAWLYLRVGSLRRLALMLVSAGAVMAPWLIRNEMVFHNGLILRSNGWAEVYFGNIDYGLHPNLASGEYQRLGEVRYTAELKQDVIAYIKQYPQKFAIDSLRRAAEFWVVPYPMMAFTLPFSLLTFAGFLLAAKSRMANSFPILASVALYPLIFYACYAFSRYRYPIEPLCFVLAGHTITLGVQSCQKVIRRRPVQTAKQVSA